MLRSQLRRRQVSAFFPRLETCLIGMEACSGARYRARELAALGHEVRLMPAALLEAVRQARKDGSGGRRGDLRSGDAADFTGMNRIARTVATA